jgi:hypothetical protein
MIFRNAKYQSKIRYILLYTEKKKLEWRVGMDQFHLHDTPSHMFGITWKLHALVRFSTPPDADEAGHRWQNRLTVEVEVVGGDWFYFFLRSRRLGLNTCRWDRYLHRRQCCLAHIGKVVQFTKDRSFLPSFTNTIFRHRNTKAWRLFSQQWQFYT